ncbi:MAG TPA: DUF4126 domain-containing protein [Solirubrobacterales bacterium]|nr:DUF4126 domain-containing protein [Solirubrobacterales bacterium]
MELVPTLISSGWASGVNAWATVLVLGLLGRAGVGTEAVPAELTETPVLAFAGVMYAIEFVADKVPLFDSVWDLGQTVFRPLVGAWVGYEFAGADGVSSVDQALAAGGTGALALASHGVKASLRLGINASPEPFTNIVASVGEDFAVAAVTALALQQPELAAAIALILLACGIALVIFVWTRIRRAWTLLRQRYGSRAPP